MHIDEVASGNLSSSRRRSSGASARHMAAIATLQQAAATNAAAAAAADAADGVGHGSFDVEAVEAAVAEAEAEELEA
eukprot:scaffold72050_cov18-Phaeocystis_antarctica.AAC.1